MIEVDWYNYWESKKLQLYGKGKYFYDEEKRLVNKIWENKRGNLIAEDFYNKQGKITNQKGYDGKGNLTNEYRSFYDKEGKIINEKWYDKEGNLTIENFYNKEEKLTNQKSYEEGTLVWEEFYNKQESITNIKRYNINENLRKEIDYYKDRGVLLYGYQKGKWTMDYKAAVRYAQVNNKNIFILFTGSDWHSVSLEMDEKVFQRIDWANYADENFALVYLDFPKEDKGLSDEQKKLNNKLRKKYHIKKFPGLIVLAKNEGQLGNFMPNTSLKAFLRRLDDIKW